MWGRYMHAGRFYTYAAYVAAAGTAVDVESTAKNHLCIRPSPFLVNLPSKAYSVSFK